MVTTYRNKMMTTIRASNDPNRHDCGLSLSLLSSDPFDSSSSRATRWASPWSTTPAPQATEEGRGGRRRRERRESGRSRGGRGDRASDFELTQLVKELAQTYKDPQLTVYDKVLSGSS